MAGLGITELIILAASVLFTKLPIVVLVIVLVMLIRILRAVEFIAEQVKDRE